MGRHTDRIRIANIRDRADVTAHRILNHTRYPRSANEVRWCMPMSYVVLVSSPNNPYPNPETATDRIRNKYVDFGIRIGKIRHASSLKDVGNGAGESNSTPTDQ